MKKLWTSFGLVLLLAGFGISAGREHLRPIKSVDSYHEAMENLFRNSSTWYDETDDLWKPSGGDRVHLARILLPEGGFVEFSLPVSGIYFHFDKSEYRSARSFIHRKHPSVSASDYLATGFEFVYATDPGPDSTMGFGQSFIPPIVALELIGPVYLEDIVYADGVRP